MTRAIDHTLLMLKWLRDGPISTLEARRRGVNHPAGRIRDLRRAGHRIDTGSTKDRGEDGRLITVALYELRPPRQLSILEVLSKGA